MQSLQLLQTHHLKQQMQGEIKVSVGDLGTAQIGTKKIKLFPN